MTERQTASIMEEAKRIYPEMFTGDDLAAFHRTWHRLMSEEKYETVLDRLDNYARENRFAPKMSDLVRPKSKYEVLK